MNEGGTRMIKYALYGAGFILILQGLIGILPLSSDSQHHAGTFSRFFFKLTGRGTQNITLVGKVFGMISFIAALTILYNLM